MESEDLFLQELKLQYDKQFEIKRDLESKANNIMTISGTVATLLFGFGTFLVDKLGSKYHLTAVVSIILILGIAANVIAIAMSARAFGIRKYRFAIVNNTFYKDGKLNGSVIDEYRKMTKTDFYETFIWDYIKCIRHNSAVNYYKAKLIVPAQWVFIISIVIIPIIVAVLLMNLPSR